ncbi:outer membrane protein assembly factor BamB family protein [Humisphaera borealis]|uniref:PQQ-binding-like beta-propeller repeat protein n=1 Tax=Humisphaera borealis TaxID=2807512 RepID=A0A7M2X1A8_9BACT|nr:PQQ-binding-like beta-propeller repeat protein [Humisphaera borealis]QOV91526.1 PQQ-binding-like beta-propeller repeat protein [Humisphaera borealis]
MRMKPLIAAVAGVAFAAVALPRLIVADSAAPAAAAPAPAAAPTSDWPAFHGGGPLVGEAKALPAGTLTARWTFKHDEPGPFEGSAVISGGSVFIGDVKGRLFCLDLATGKPKWTYTIEAGFEASPLVVNGKVFIGDLGGLFHCVSAEEGKKLWTFDTGSGQPIHASANVFGNKLIFGDDGANVICVNADDGKKVWQVETGDRVNAAPAIGGGLAFISGCDAKLRAIQIENGKEKFAVELQSLAPGSPALLPDRIILGTDGGRVLAIAADGSKILWTYENVKDGAMVYSSSAVSEGIVVVGARDRLVHAIDAQTGAGKWTFATRGEVNSSPAIAGGKVYVGSRDKKLYVLDLKTGKKLDEFQASRAIEGSPAIGQGVVVVGDTSGAVYCLEPK